jgi:hypothetical protein
MIFLAPPLKCADAFSLSRNAPVDSTMYSAPAEAHAILEGSFSPNTLIGTPSMIRLLASWPTVPRHLPCTVSYLYMYSM